MTKYNANYYNSVSYNNCHYLINNCWVLELKGLYSVTFFSSTCPVLYICVIDIRLHEFFMPVDPSLHISPNMYVLYRDFSIPQPQP